MIYCHPHLLVDFSLIKSYGKLKFYCVYEKRTVCLVLKSVSLLGHPFHAILATMMHFNNPILPLGAILGPFVGYLFSARLNKMRFQKMEQIINTKLNLLSLSTISVIREIHGLDTDVISEPEKLTIIKRLILMFEFIKSSLMEAFHSLSTSIMIEDMEQDINNDKNHQIAPAKPETKEAGVQAVIIVKPDPELKLTVPRIVDKVSIPDLKAVLTSLKAIEEKQDTLENHIVDFQELQDANKIEVSVNSSDDEIIKILQSDQSMTKKTLLALQDNLKILQISLNKSLKGVQSNIDSLSMKITNSPELYIGNLEHSKILNDASKSLTNIKENIEAMEAIYSDDIRKQFSELTNIRHDLSNQMEVIKNNRQIQINHFQEMSNSFTANKVSSSKIESVIDKMVSILHAVHTDNSTEVILLKMEELTDALNEMKSLIISSGESYENNFDNVAESVSKSLNGNLADLEESLSQQHENLYSSFLEKLEEISIPQSNTLRNDSSCQTEKSKVERVLSQLTISHLDPDLNNAPEEIPAIMSDMSIDCLSCSETGRVEDNVIIDETATVPDSVVRTKTVSVEDSVICDETVSFEDSVISDETASVEDSVISEKTAVVKDSVISNETATTVPDSVISAETASVLDSELICEETASVLDSVICDETVSVKDNAISEETGSAIDSVISDETASAIDSVISDETASVEDTELICEETAVVKDNVICEETACVKDNAISEETASVLDSVISDETASVLDNVISDETVNFEDSVICGETTSAENETDNVICDETTGILASDRGVKQHSFVYVYSTVVVVSTLISYLYR